MAIKWQYFLYYTLVNNMTRFCMEIYTCPKRWAYYTILPCNDYSVTVVIIYQLDIRTCTAQNCSESQRFNDAVIIFIRHAVHVRVYHNHYYYDPQVVHSGHNNSCFCIVHSTKADAVIKQRCYCYTCMGSDAHSHQWSQSRFIYFLQLYQGWCCNKAKTLVLHMHGKWCT